MPHVWTHDESRDYPTSKAKAPKPKFARVEMRHCDDEGYQCRDCGKPRGWPHDHRCRWDYANLDKLMDEDAKERRAKFTANVDALLVKLGKKAAS